jgi:peptidyl-tRNA hydrolase
MGISRPDMKGDEQGFVLGAFNPQEKKALKDHMDKGKEAVKTIIVEGTSVAMNRFNRRVRLMHQN